MNLELSFKQRMSSTLPLEDSGFIKNNFTRKFEEVKVEDEPGTDIRTIRVHEDNSKPQSTFSIKINVYNDEFAQQLPLN